MNPYQNLYGPAKVGHTSTVGSYSDIGGEVGEGCKIQAFAFIPPGVKIGNFVFIGPRVTFTNDKYPKALGDWTPLTTVVEDYASIGAGAVINPGLTIGREAVIGSGAVVTHNVPPGETWVGNPARRLK